MSDDATPRLGLPYLAAAQAQKHVTVNAAFALLDGLVSTSVRSRTTAAEPASPADGDLYILPASPTGADWAPHPTGTLMRFEAGAWAVMPAEEGQLAWVHDEAAMLVLTASGWAPLVSFQNLALLGVGATADPGSPLTVRGPAALFTNAGAGVQLKLNKATAADTASLLFQTGYGGRAEVGLCGDDSLHVKVSADGSSWHDAFTVDAASGRVGFGTVPTAKLQVEGSVRVKSYSKAALPDPGAEGSGAMIHVYDDSLGSTIAFSDGGSWRRVHDRNPVA